MRPPRLPVIQPRSANVGDTGALQKAEKGSGSFTRFDLGVLSLHFEGGRCRVNCPFCYLGKRADGDGKAGLDEAIVEAALATLPYRELAVALSEPIEPVLPLLERLGRAAAARQKPIALTTTVAVALALPASVLGQVQRLNLSVDPFKGQHQGQKGQVEVADIARVLSAVRERAQLEHVLIVTLSTPHFAEQLWSGLLAELVALPIVDRVALNALKPPPPWCDRAFWLKALHRIRPLLSEHLDRRLFLDCYVAARILGIGGCPARPDLSPPSAAAGGGVAFRSCVYQPAADFVVHSGDELAARLADFTPPAQCPFPID